MWIWNASAAGSQPSFHDGFHQVQTAPRRVGLVSESAVGRTGGKAEAAMDATHESLLLVLKRAFKRTSTESGGRRHGHRGANTPEGSKSLLILSVTTSWLPIPPVEETRPVRDGGAVLNVTLPPKSSR